MPPTDRSVVQIIEPQHVIEGAGVLLRRSFGPRRENLFDPFLLFDHFAFNDPLEGLDPRLPNPSPPRDRDRDVHARGQCPPPRTAWATPA